jgi:hypothetical protein
MSFNGSIIDYWKITFFIKCSFGTPSRFHDVQLSSQGQTTRDPHTAPITVLTCDSHDSRLTLPCTSNLISLPVPFWLNGLPTPTPCCTSIPYSFDRSTYLCDI